MITFENPAYGLSSTDTTHNSKLGVNKTLSSIRTSGIKSDHNTNTHNSTASDQLLVSSPLLDVDQ